MTEEPPSSPLLVYLPSGCRPSYDDLSLWRVRGKYKGKQMGQSKLWGYGDMGRITLAPTSPDLRP